MEKEFSEAYRVFKNQKDRFELKECHLYYNGQMVPIYDTLYKTRKLFGTNYDREFGYSYLDKPLTINKEYFNVGELMKHDDWYNGRTPIETDSNMRLKSLRIPFFHKKPDGYGVNDRRNDSLDALIPTARYMLVEGSPLINTQILKS